MKKIIACCVLLYSICASAFGPWATTGEMTTESFFVSSSEWKVVWDLSPSDRGSAWISVNVHDKADGGLIESASAEISGKGQTIIHRSGQFYLTISVIGSARVWTE